MNISKDAQRVLHVPAQGGMIRFVRAPNGRLQAVECVTHDGAILTGCTLEITARLRGKRLIESRNSAPCRTLDRGRRSVRARADNRV